MPKLYQALILLILLACGLDALYAQQKDSCALKLKVANDYFTEGKIELFSDSLEKELLSCINRGFLSGKEVEAYKLLTIRALLTHNTPKADTYFKELLRIQPGFNLDLTQQTDPAELIYLYRAFRTRPLLAIDYQVGVIGSGVITGQRYAADNSQEPASYGYVPGLVIGAEILLPVFNRNFGLVTGLNFARRQFTYSDELQTLSTPAASQPYFQLSFTEREDWLEVPVMLRYDFDKVSAYNFERNQLVPTLEGGFSYARLVNAKFIDPQRNNLITASQLGQSIDVSEMRKPFQAYLNAGAGLKYKWNDHYFFFKVRYTQGLTNQVSTANRYSPNLRDLIYTYGYVDDDFTLRGLSLTIGFEQSIYVPQRKNKP